MKFRTLRADEIEARVATVKQNGCSLLLYKDSRVDMNLLDETVGEFNWQRRHSRENANCTVSIWDETKKQWIEKEDTGTESNTEKEKGLASDSFKRACFNWGIGRELYTAPFIWINAEKCKIVPKGQGFTTYDKFEVADIGYDENRRINRLVITKDNSIVYKMGSKTPDRISATKVQAIRAKAKSDGVSEDRICELYKVNSLSELTEEKHQNLVQFWERLVAENGK